MSKMTDVNQANMYCGFYPSNAGDRKYGSLDFGRFLDGLVCDGVFLTLYDQFKVSPNSGRSVIVGTGKAWFNHTWLELTDEYAIECEESYQDGDRYDAIVIAINTTNNDVTYDGRILPARDTTIVAIKGSKSTAGNPVVPITVSNQEVSEGVYLYPLADIYRARTTTTITAGDIRIRVGEAVCPYVESLVTPSNSATEFVEMWRAQLDKFIDGLQSDWNSEKERYNDDWTLYFTAKKTEMDNWFSEQTASYEYWKNTVLDDSKNDAVGSLLFTTYEHEIRSYLMHGLPDGTKTASDDGKTITHANARFILTKVFSDDFSSYVTTLKTVDDVLVATSEVIIDSTGNSTTTMSLSV